MADNDGGEQRGIRTALKRYQVMAIVTGVFLILVFVGVYIEYVVKPESESLLALVDNVQFVHGFIYIVYLWMSIDLWTRVKWGWGRLAILILGGIIPLLTFWAERRVTRDVAGILNP